MEGLKKRAKTLKYTGPFKHTITHYENLQKILDARATKKADIMFRRTMIQRQNRNNYQMEYDRLRNLIEGKLITGQNEEMAKERIKQLKELGAKVNNFLQ